jgi:two-component system phosphate regulon sensor histidine kinase PhoR
MNLSKPSRFAVTFSLVFSLMLVVIVLLFGWLHDVTWTTKSWIFLVASLIFFGLTVFLFLYHSIGRFIYDKIRVIYKTILQQKKSPKASRKSLFQDDSIEKVNQEVVQWEKDTRQKIEDLEQRAQYRREFIGNVSHELKTPIFNIQGYILTLLDGAIDDPKINVQYLERTEKSINRLISIIEDLEDISALESGVIKVNPAPFNLIQLAKDAIEQMEVKAQKRHIKLYFRKKYDKSIMVSADYNRIRQVFINLIDNSIKYGKDGGSTKLSFFDMHDHILCEVTDDGPGIPDESVSRIFERFYRTDKARSREQGGSGLGLAIVKHIIDAHGQTINVRSKMGVGTTFAFTLQKAGH